MYMPEGQEMIERLWEETMIELDFAGIRNALESMRS